MGGAKRPKHIRCTEAAKASTENGGEAKCSSVGQASAAADLSGFVHGDGNLNQTGKSACPTQTGARQTASLRGKIIEGDREIRTLENHKGAAPVEKTAA
jgi:hypothetical protein